MFSQGLFVGLSSPLTIILRVVINVAGLFQYWQLFLMTPVKFLVTRGQSLHTSVSVFLWQCTNVILSDSEVLKPCMVWSSLCLQMPWYLTVSGHQQTQGWMKWHFSDEVFWLLGFVSLCEMTSFKMADDTWSSSWVCRLAAIDDM